MDHGLQKGDELRDRSTAELNEAAVVRVRLWEPEGTGGARRPTSWMGPRSALQASGSPPQQLSEGQEPYGEV